jgi:NhaP-type Na+/H+ or K+/H+ antiporter
MFLLLTFVAFGASLLWMGLTVVDWRTLAFALIALVARTATLYPVLARADLDRRSRRLIAWLGPRGLSSLLLVLLPVFEGVAGAANLFAIASLVVLLSVVVHGSGIALWLRRDTMERRKSAAQKVPAEATTEPRDTPPSTQLPPSSVPIRTISIDEVRTRLTRANNLHIVDSRSARTWNQDGLKARGAVRVPPDDAVRAAREQRLSQHGTLVVYCA